MKSLEIGDILRKVYDIFYHRPMNFSFVDDHLCGSARIMSTKDVDWLKTKGVNAMLALTETPAPSSWIEGFGIEYKQVPIKNHTAPTLAQLEDCVAFIERNIQKENKVLVHCAAGKGRTGTIIAAYLCARDNIPAELAIERVRAKRHGSVERNPRSGQENAVAEYQKSLHKKSE